MTADAHPFVQAAEQLGRRICDAAVWHDGRCNWLGRGTFRPGTQTAPETAVTQITRALGPDLYGGTGGIALFLSRLYTVTGESRWRIHAEGAAHHAATHAGRVPPSSSFGLYDGTLGVSFTLAEVGTLLDDACILARARAVLEAATRSEPPSNSFDLMSGSAGGIVVLTALADRFPELPLLPTAIRLGERLLDGAKKDGRGWSWPSLAEEPGRDGRHLTGFSHGVAGIAYGLLELFSATNDRRFADGATAAFRYENSWYRAEHNNWPDFRHIDGQQGDELGFPVAWCHGATGIGLSRFRAYELLDDTSLLADARNAAARTRQAIIASGDDLDDLSLCHGDFGRCDLLLTAARQFPEETDLAIVEEVADRARTLCGGDDTDVTWPCGVGDGETPGLMLGLAGIGYFFLRLDDPAGIPSILAPARTTS